MILQATYYAVGRIAHLVKMVGWLATLCTLRPGSD